MNTFLLLNCPIILILSPNNEPKLNGEVGSIAKTAILNCFDNLFRIALTKVLLPAPGGPVIPITGVFFIFNVFKIAPAPAKSFSTIVSKRANDLMSPRIKLSILNIKSFVGIFFLFIF